MWLYDSFESTLPWYTQDNVWYKYWYCVPKPNTALLPVIVFSGNSLSTKKICYYCVVDRFAEALFGTDSNVNRARGGWWPPLLCELRTGPHRGRHRSAWRPTKREARGRYDGEGLCVRACAARARTRGGVSLRGTRGGVSVRGACPRPCATGRGCV